MYMLLFNERSGYLGSKCRRHANGGFFSKSNKKIFHLSSIQHSDLIEKRIGAMVIIENMQLYVGPNAQE